MPIRGIYAIQSPSGKVYIGQSRNILSRKNQYKRGDCKGQMKLFASIQKHGWGTHIFNILHELPNDVDQEIVNIYECLYMELYKQSGFTLLNIRSGGHKGAMAAETKAKLSNIKKGTKRQPHWKVGGWKKGERQHTEETKKLIASKATGRKHSEETLKRLKITAKAR